MIWLQYEDPDKDDGAHKFRKIVYEDEEYQQALVHYEQMRGTWEKTRLLFENDERPSDWVLLQDDSIVENDSK